MDKQKLIKIFDKQANQYDKRRGNLASDRIWRQQLLSAAKGNILELAVGAGANFPFYTNDVTKIVAVDFSKEMLEKAKNAAEQYRMNVEFVCSDIEKLDFKEQTFDTVISTLSMCSYENPLRVLKQMKRWCKPDGKILLLEHGISPNAIVSVLQKALNPLLYNFYGCHHTRDILKLVQDAELKIVHNESHWFNMIHVIQAKC